MTFAEALEMLCLEPLAVLDVEAEQAVKIAAAAEFRRMSLWVHSPTPQFYAPCVVTRANLAEVRRLMDGEGILPCNLEVFRVGPGTDVAAYEAALSVGAEAGARSATAIAKDDSEGTVETFARLCDLAANYGLRVNVEFLSYRKLSTLQQAVRLVSAAARPNGGVLIDILHLVRSGGSVEEVGRLDRGLINHVQICDGPKAMPVDQLEFESASNRLLPGDGEFPLAAFIAALPTANLGIEIPRSSVAFANLPPADRVVRAMQAMRHFLAAQH